VSDWELGKSQIDKDHRCVLTSLIKVLRDNGGLRTRTEANTFLLAGNYRPLDEEEIRQIFPAETATVSPEPGSYLGSIFALLREVILQPGRILRRLQPDLTSGPSAWAGVLLGLMGRISSGWSAERVLRVIAWMVVWLLTWELTFPLLYWPFADRRQAWTASLVYAAGAIIIPTVVGALTNTKDDRFWQTQFLAKSLALRFYTHLGAFAGFHTAYMMVFAGALIGYNLGFSTLPHWLIGIVATWPVLIAYAAARQVPFNMWCAFSRLHFKDGAVFLIFALFGPLWGSFFFNYHSWLLSPAGIILVLLAIGTLAALITWQHRAGNPIIPAHIWAALFGFLLVLYQISSGRNLFGTVSTAGIVVTVVILMAQKHIHVTLAGGILSLLVLGLLLLCLKLNVWLGRMATVIAMLGWWFKGRKYIWFPLSFLGVVIAIIVCAMLIQQGILNQFQSSAVLILSLTAILWIQSRG
jgi:hypothetical protein